MADAIGERKLGLKERLKAAIQGDSKPGSIREHLAEGLTNLSEFSPLGVVYAGQDMEEGLNKGRYGDAAISAMGMIPGAGKGASTVVKMLESLHPAERQAVQMALDTFQGGKGEAKELGDILEAAQYSRRSFNPNQQAILESALAKLTGNPVVGGTKLSEGELISKSPRNPNERNRVSAVDQHVQDLKMRADVGHGSRAVVRGDPLRDPALNPKQKADLEKFEAAKANRDRGATSVGEDDLIYNRLNRGDDEALDQLARFHKMPPEKLNFIKNAMQDEGGNIPEDVLMTLMDHAESGNKVADLAKLLGHGEGTYASKDPQALRSVIEGTQLSIPEMLSLHYDLDPEKFKNVYSNVGQKPTQ